MDLAKLFDSFYNRFILRDVFGKIVPGFILLSGIVLAFSSPEKIYAAMKPFLFKTSAAELNSVSLWVILLSSLGIGWLAGLGIERLGEIAGILVDPPRKLTEQRWLNLIIFFDRDTMEKPYERSQRERMVVIKEACGNASVALGVAALSGIWIVNEWGCLILTGVLVPLANALRVADDREQEALETRVGLITGAATLALLYQPGPFPRLNFVTLGAAIFLWLMHLKIARRQGIYMEDVVSFPLSCPKPICSIPEIKRGRPEPPPPAAS